MSSDLARWYHSMTFTYANEWDDTIRVVGKHLIIDPDVYTIENGTIIFQSDRIVVTNGTISAVPTKHGHINTWDDWHLIPTSRPVFQQGDVKTNYIDIPGADGQIDVSEALSGYPTFKNREGSLEFIVANGWRNSWAAGFSKFANWLHGKVLRVVLDDDPGYFYEGRFSLNEWKSNNDGTWSNVTIDYNLKPYKYSVLVSTDDWLWDDFCFETDVIYNGYQIPITATRTLTVNNNEMHVIPTFIISGTQDTKWTLELNGNSFDVTLDLASSGGKQSFSDPRLELTSGANTLRVTAQTSGTLDISFRGGSL